MNTEPWVTAEQVAQHLRVGGADEDSKRKNVDHTAAPEAGKA